MSGEDYFEEYKKHTDTRFNALTTLMNAHFTNVTDKLNSIEGETKRTNGRVTELEGDIITLEKDLSDARQWGQHIVDTRNVNCPNLPEFRKYNREIQRLEKKIDNIADIKSSDVNAIKENLAEYNIMKKYPKAVIIILAFGILTIVAAVVASINTTRNFFKTRELIETVGDVQMDKEDVRK